MGTFEPVVLCGASAYDEKYYFNHKFDRLPEQIKQELQIICVLFTEEIGGWFFLEFSKEGELMFRTEALDSDYNYDEIGAALMVKEIRNSRSELLASLELFYQVVFLGKRLEDTE